MAKAELLKPFILKWEGGFANDPADSGGATNKGVTIATFRHYYGNNVTVAQLKAMTDEQWMHIFKDGFWNAFMADCISSQSIANICVDWAWASGTVTAVRQVQRVLGVDVDGKVGHKTLASINNANAKTLFGKIRTARLAFVEGVAKRSPKKKKFLNGWKNRINSIEFSE